MLSDPAPSVSRMSPGTATVHGAGRRERRDTGPTDGSTDSTSDGQWAFDDLGSPLQCVDFVVVDLETTGGSSRDCHITEIGAVRTRGGEVVGEFHTLVNPGTPIPAFIAALTGITDAAVAGAPPIGTVLPMFLDFARDAVLVAHNAPFDTGFLRAAASRTGHDWPSFPVVDTARLARVLLHRDEVRNNKLATLARHFHASVTPDHRALNDARATVTVLHGLLERAGDLGAHHLEDLQVLTSRVRPEQRRKRTMADGLPTGPGVYRFLAADGRTLYTGKAASLRTRVRQYFTASEKRGRVLEMVRIADRVEVIECATELEASVREVRLISAEKPPYNRRSRHAERMFWLTLSDDFAPRLSVTRRRGDVSVGPFPSQRAARAAADVIHLAFPLRTCTHRLGPNRRAPACLRADLGSCVAPCRDVSAADPYRLVAAAAGRSLQHDLSPVVGAVSAELAALAAAERFEEAARLRDALRHLLATVEAGDALTMLGSCPQIVAASPVRREWHVHVIRHGRLVSAARVRPDQDPRAVVDAAVATAADVPRPDGVSSATAEEGRLLLGWLGTPGTRLVSLDGVLSQPRHGIRPSLTALLSARADRPEPRHEGVGHGRGPLRSRLATLRAGA